jgi:hypothetical protein
MTIYTRDPSNVKVFCSGVVVMDFYKVATVMDLLRECGYYAFNTAWDHKIRVIKIVRGLTMMGLKEAKDMVEFAMKCVDEAVDPNEMSTVVVI